MSVDNFARKQMILDAAARLIIQYGYDKTTMSDIAGAVGLNRSLIYPYFKSKDEVLEALITREMQKYGQLWFEHLMDDPSGGTVASIYRSVAYALKNTPFMGAIVARDADTFGKYLRKPGNIFEGMQSPGMTRELLRAMQTAGVIRPDVNLPAMAYIVDILANGMVEQNNGKYRGEVPPYEDVLNTIAEMFDRMLTPTGGGNMEAGKEVLRQFAESARTYFEQVNENQKGSSQS